MPPPAPPTVYGSIRTTTPLLSAPHLSHVLGPTSYLLRTYMAAPDNALRGIIYNGVDSQIQDEIVQDLQSMNVNMPYAIADARQMGHSKSILVTFVGTTTIPSAIVFNCGIYRCYPFRPKAEACTNCWAPGHRADVCTKPKSTLCHRCGQAHKAVEPRPAFPAASCAREPTSRARVRASSGSTGTARRHLRPPLSPSLPHQRPPPGPSTRPLGLPAAALPPVVPGLPAATTPSPSRLCPGPRRPPPTPPHHR
ncbi:hypothetical protein HPB49_004599 [Dermacentor silvarum]|uniref:Uncharacterized protein n=1 Tax=Dermacentor silvarum TaxID=543639 RepID=A0ACB8CVC5_DERSI|nr:hypothetical protein HPB49_004599 [Dermacentor silvarum]